MGFILIFNQLIKPSFEECLGAAVGRAFSYKPLCNLGPALDLSVPVLRFTLSGCRILNSISSLL